MDLPTHIQLACPCAHLAIWPILPYIFRSISNDTASAMADCDYFDEELEVCLTKMQDCVAGARKKIDSATKAGLQSRFSDLAESRFKSLTRSLKDEVYKLSNANALARAALETPGRSARRGRRFPARGRGISGRERTAGTAAGPAGVGRSRPR